MLGIDKTNRYCCSSGFFFGMGFISKEHQVYIRFFLCHDFYVSNQFVGSW